MTVTSDQPARISAIRGNASVIDAAAGSGKTETIVLRVLRHVIGADGDPVPIDRIALATFTIAAAGELRARARAGLEHLRAWSLTPSGDWNPPPKSFAERVVSVLVDLPATADAAGAYRQQVRERCEQALEVLDSAPWGTLHSVCLTLVHRTAWMHPAPAALAIAPSRPALAELLARRDTRDLLRSPQLTAWIESVTPEPFDRSTKDGQQLTADTAAKLVARIRDGAVGQHAIARHLSPGLVDHHAPHLRWAAAVAAAADVVDDPGRLGEPPNGVSWSTALGDLAVAQPADLTQGNVTGFLATVLAGGGQGEFAAAARTRVQAFLTTRPAAGPALTATAVKLKDQSYRPPITIDATGAKALREPANHVAQLLAPPPIRSVVAAAITDIELQRVAADLQQRARTGEVRYDDVIVLAVQGLDTVDQATRPIDLLVVDEVQDCDPAQWALIDALAGLGVRTVVVGDRRQSIYGFRGAVPESFEQRVQQITTGADPEAGSVARLSVAFRHGPAMTAAVNALFAHPPAWSGVAVPDVHAGHGTDTGEPGIAVLVHEVDGTAATTRRRNAEIVAALVAQRAATSATHYRDIAVLTPKRTGWTELLDAFRQAGIPYQCHSGQLAWNTHGARGLASLLRWLASGDQVNRRGLLLSPWFGWTIGQVTDADAVTAALAPIREAVTTGAGAGQATRQAIAAIGAYRLVKDLCHPDTPHPARPDLAAGLLTDIRFVLDEAVAYEEATGNGLAGFVRDVIDGGEDTDRVRGASTGELANAVHVLTIHGAKGLQYPHVIVANIDSPPGGSERVLWPVHPDRNVAVAITTDRKFPRRSFAYKACDPDADHAACSPGESFIAERDLRRSQALDRLLYVAATRAKLTTTILVSATADKDATPDPIGAADRWLAEPVDGPPDTIAGVLHTRLLALAEAGGTESAAIPPDSRIAVQPAGTSTPVRATAPDPVHWAEPVQRNAPQIFPTRTGSSFHENPRTTTPSTTEPPPLFEDMLDEDPAADQPEAALPDEDLPAGDDSVEIKSGPRFGTAVHECVHVLAMRATAPPDAHEEATRILRRLPSAVGVSVDDAAAAAARVYRSPLLRGPGVQHEYPVLAPITAPDGSACLGGGVIDVIRFDSDGATVIDIKTDHVAPGDVMQLVDRYQTQLEIYARALEATGCPVSGLRLLLADPGAMAADGTGLVVDVPRLTRTAATAATAPR